jgi:hypothetical protein
VAGGALGRGVVIYAIQPTSNFCGNSLRINTYNFEKHKLSCRST